MRGGGGGFFPRVTPTAAPQEAEDPLNVGAIASRVAEQIGNTRGVSESERRRASQEEAGRPPMTRTITENPDGTKTLTVKNVPPGDPADNVRRAANEPYAQFVQRVLSEGVEVGNVQADSLQQSQDTLDSMLSTREGRIGLASQLGVEDPADVPGEFMHSGVFRYRAKRREYEKLISDPEKLRMAILTSKFGALTKTADTLRPFASDAASEETRGRLQAAEDRQARNQEFTERERIVDNVRQFDLSHLKSADEAVAQWKAMYGDRWDELKDVLEPLARSQYATRSVERNRKEVETTIREKKEARAEAKNDDERTKLDLQIRNLQSIIENREKPKLKKVRYSEAIGAHARDLAELADDEEFDPKSVSDALRWKSESLDREESRLKADRVRNRALLGALKAKGYADPGDPEQQAIAEARVQEVNERLNDMKAERDIIAGVRDSKKSTAAAAPAKKGVAAGVVVNRGGKLVYEQPRQ